MSDTNNASEAKTSAVVQLALAWFVVAVPLLWGVAQTFNKALALFK